MRGPVRLATALLAAPVLAGLPAADRDRVVATITDERVTESSALVQSTLDPELAYTVNDSGDGAYVYVLELATGGVVGVATLRGITAVDVEALAIGADDRLYVADVGDNAGQRPRSAVHSLAQPGRGDVTAAVRTYPLRHAGGPQDVESLLIDPVDGTAYLVTKGLLGGQVHRIPRLQEGRLAVARLVEGVDVPGLVTDGAYLPDGSGVVLRTYGGAVVYAMPGWRDFAQLELPAQRQGESIAAVNGGPVLYVGTEGLPSPIQRARIPDRVWRQLHPTPAATPGPQPEAVPTAADGELGLPEALLGSSALLVVLGACWLSVHRRRRAN